MAGQIGLPAAAAYGATKGAKSSMTRAWAAEFSPSGVRVNAIAPGPVYTPGAAHERIRALGTTTLLNRAADAEEIAEVVGFSRHTERATSPKRSLPPMAVAPRSEYVHPDASLSGSIGR